MPLTIEMLTRCSTWSFRRNWATVSDSGFPESSDDISITWRSTLGRVERDDPEFLGEVRTGPGLSTALTCERKIGM